MTIPIWVYDILKEAAGILLVLCPLLSQNVRDFVAKKIQLSFDKALEDKKSVNERKTYISKAKFDKEFSLYQNISKNQMDVIYDCGTAVVIARGGYDKDKSKRNTFIDEFLQHLETADIYLKCNAPFISKKIFEQYREIDRKASEIARLISCLNFTMEVATGFNINDKEYTNASAKEEIERLQRQITVLVDETHQSIREYLESLEKI